MSADVYSKSADFAVRIVKLYQYLCGEKKEFTISRQLLRSGTSIGANLSEAKYAESTDDFIHKASVSLKECSETEYWLSVLSRTDYLNEREYESIRCDCSELAKLLTAILKTMKEKREINNS